MQAPPQRQRAARTFFKEKKQPWVPPSPGERGEKTITLASPLEEEGNFRRSARPQGASPEQPWLFFEILTPFLKYVMVA